MTVTVNSSSFMKPAAVNTSASELKTADASANDGGFQKIFAQQIDQKQFDQKQISRQQADQKQTIKQTEKQPEKKPEKQITQQNQEAETKQDTPSSDGNSLLDVAAGKNTLETLQLKVQSARDAAIKGEHGIDKRKLAQLKTHDAEAAADTKVATDKQAAVDSDLNVSADADTLSDKKSLKKTSEHITVTEISNGNSEAGSSLLMAMNVQATTVKPTAVKASSANEDNGESSLLDIAQQQDIAQQKRSAKQDALLDKRTSAEPTDKNALADNLNAKTKDASSSIETMQQQVDFNQTFEKKLAMQQTAVQANVANIQAPATVAATSIVNPAMALQQTEISAKFGTDRWNAEVGQKVVWMVGAEQQSATLTLNPPDLGPVQVVIQVHNDQADTTFISQNPEVRQALQDGLSVLRDMMANNGIQLGEANIHAQQQEHQHAQQNFRQQQGQDQSNTASRSEVFSAAPVNTYVSNGLVDTFA